jgi:osmotically inducible lipoprotein OsmB
MSKNFRKLSILAVLILLTGCAGMTHRERNTALGATAGGVVGSILSEGDPLLTAGAAALGAAIGYNNSSSSHHRR